ncbi:hypothetical protein BC831DRAFT_243536 [Entophlyctis helioformis]|nr:hypothetical protein BC831DRAFT_243536 [Entophlyctis helioformis]
MADTGYQSVLCVIKEVVVYRIPPRATARGYRASDWNVDQFLWKGRMRVMANGDECALHLEDAVTGELFAKCPYALDGSSVESVLDSSRYFVIKIVDPGSGNHAFVGIGFPERSWAFDFNVALQDHVKRVRNARQSKSKQAVEDDALKVDYSLKDGQKFIINLGAAVKKATTANTGSSSGSDLIALLPPPPGSAAFAALDANKARGFATAPPSGMAPLGSGTDLFTGVGSTGSNGSNGFDDFGDFASVPAPTAAAAAAAAAYRAPAIGSASGSASGSGFDAGFGQQSPFGSAPFAPTGQQQQQQQQQPQQQQQQQTAAGAGWVTF